MQSSFPFWMVPMAATLTQRRFTGPEWIFERKLDGIRVLAFKNGSDVRLLSRNKLPLNDSYPAVAAAIATLPVHDDVTSLPLDERRELLSRIPLRLPLAQVPSLDDPEPWDRACRDGWEGVIAKRRDSPYEHRRSPHWLKMKCELKQHLAVGGFTDPQGKRVGLGALLVGYFEGEDLVFAGRVGTGFDTRLLLDLRARLDAMEIPKAPFTVAKGLPKLRAHWTRPEIVVEVAFIEWTGHGKLRHPRLLGVRLDQEARVVARR